ncbi:hypothetical protein [Clostridium omnivorum]|uniref:Holin n=1 Tax=Clostridium omnivorum TaxID=1604902 RepID=A0ABQ5N2V9_9CLOT|nr:hypothetical protein [Clostridium sp. E14]GLC29496.1 hypothetical protein bsdE14_09060 [Clostridium sp. E14]
MSDINSLSPNELSIAATAIAIAIAEGRTADEVNVLGNFIIAVGSILTTIAAQEASLENINKASKENKKGK